MEVHQKTIIERRRELERLVQAISRVIDWIESCGHFADASPTYRECQQEALRLLANGFDQPSLSELAGRIPLLIDLHPRWEPPLIAGEDGSYATQTWFEDLKPLHDELVASAGNLRVIGRT